MNEKLQRASEPATSGEAGGPVFKWIAGGLQKLIQSPAILTPEESARDPELMRQARLISGFGVLGTFFGAVYATFYVLIGHRWGALIVIVCSLCFAVTPLVMRCKRSIAPAGHWLVATLICGFTGLCFVEGGLQGHAIAWLVSVPLCALLLLGQKAATQWAVLAFLAASLVIGLDLAGVKLPVSYDLKWNGLVSATGYLGLVIFMFALGLLFETSRKRAFVKMQAALAELAAANERLVHLNHEKNEFLGIAAHDLRNPLTTILGSAELAGMVKDPREVAKLLGNIAQSATRMSGLINDLLDVNAIEAGTVASVTEPCNLLELAAQAVKNNQPAAAKKSMPIRLEPAGELWAAASPAATLQILDNLISNAIKYAPPGTTVHVRTRLKSHQALVSVRDEGPGLSESDQKKLFQKFTRLTARPTGGESSTGLGLAIVKRLAEAMSGSIECQSALGAGATFTLGLPVCPQPAAGAAVEKRPASTAPLRAVIPEPALPLLGKN